MATSLRIALIVGVAIAVTGQIASSGAWFLGELYGSYGSAALSAGDLNAAKRLYRRAVQTQPYRADWRYLEGVVLRKTDGRAASLPPLLAALEREPNNPSTLVSAAETLALLNETPAASRLLDHATKVAPYDWRVRHVEGLVAALEGHHDEAVASLSAALDLAESPPPSVLSLLASESYELGNYADALAHADAALKEQPHQPDHRVTRAKALLALGQVEEARRSARQALRAYQQLARQGQEPGAKLTEAQRYHAEALARLGNKEAALNELLSLRATASDGQLRDTMTRLAESASVLPEPLLGVIADALIDLDEAPLASQVLALEGTVAAFRPLLHARLLAATGKPEAAIAVLQDLPRSVANSPRGRLALGEAHAAAGRYASARLELRSLLGAPGTPGHVQRRAAHVLDAIADQ